jgi:hypothetical protein
MTRCPMLAPRAVSWQRAERMAHPNGPHKVKPAIDATTPAHYGETVTETLRPDRGPRLDRGE